jgi:hypothetical protein
LPTEVTLTTDEGRQDSKIKVWISISSFMRRFPMILVNVFIQAKRLVRVFKGSKFLWVLDGVIGHPVRADGCENIS